MNKTTRKAVFEKYSGLCAYTGKPLGDDWQIDHVISKKKHEYLCWQKKRNDPDFNYPEELKKADDICNLMPTCRIVNHYKRELDLEGFRLHMKDFHKRLAKLPKNTRVPATERRKQYMYTLADLFGIESDKPFSGVFYFETLNTNKTDELTNKQDEQGAVVLND